MDRRDMLKASGAAMIVTSLPAAAAPEIGKGGWDRTKLDQAAAVMAAWIKDGRVAGASIRVTQGRRQRILLHHCPFLEAARQHPEVVCAVHVGLMDGVLGQMGARARTDRLEPFVAPDLCIAHLTSRRSDGADRDPGRTVLAGVQN